MSDTYGGLFVPVPVAVEAQSGFPPIVTGDAIIGYFASYLATIMTTYAGDAWKSIYPAFPIVKTIHANSPEDDFNSEHLPCLYVYRPGRETREVLDTFEQVADDYRFQKGRVEVQWIMNKEAQANQRARNQMIDAIRKVIDRAVQWGRDPAWKIPNDDDVKTSEYGSSLFKYTGAAVIELDHAAPGTYIHKMMLPAPDQKFDELKMSFSVEELLVRDLELIGYPNETGKLEMESPDQGTGLGPFDLGDGIYE